MSLSPHAAALRQGQKMGDMSYVDTMIRDGLWDAFNGYHMGQTAENVAEQWQISRDMQDEFAVASQNKAEAAQKAGKFDDEVIPFTIKTRKGDIVMDKDEYIRHGATIDAMAKLRPAFTKDGSVTAANASGINDGAAGVLTLWSKASITSDYVISEAERGRLTEKFVPVLIAPLTPPPPFDGFKFATRYRF